MDVDEFIENNADPLWLHQNEMWEYIQAEKVKTFIEFKLVSITKAGDYYQIMFHDGLDTEEEPYFLIQSQFEFPDGGVCYFESHNEELIEHCKVKSVSLSTHRIILSYGEELNREVEIEFGLHGVDFQDLASTLKEMIPEVKFEL